MFRNIIRSFLTKGCVALINFMLLIISARYLGISSRGEISIFILNLSMIQIINEIYTGYTLVHFVPRFNLAKLFSVGIIYTLLFCSLSNLLIVFVNRQVPGFEWLGYFISFLVLLNTFNCVLIIGKELVITYNFLSLLQPLTLLVGLGVFIFVLKDFTFKAYVYPLFISFVLASVISTFVTLKFILKANVDKGFQIKPVLVNGFLYQAGILMYVFCNRYSYYLLPDRRDVGLYASAASFVESVLIIMNGIAPVLLARVAREGPFGKSTEITLSLSKLSLLLSTLVLFGMLLLPESLFVFVLGKGFVGIKHLMWLYAPGVLCVSFFGVVANYFLALGKPGLVLFCNSFGCLLSLLLAPFLVRLYETSGAAYVADLAYAAIAIATCFCFFKVGGLPFRRLFSIKEDYRNVVGLLH